MADEYIRKADVKNLRFSDGINHDGFLYVPYKELVDGIKALPSADVVQVRHGRWIDMGDHGDWQWETDGRGSCWHLWECNRCDGKVKIKTDFCPHCGAKMDKE